MNDRAFYMERIDQILSLLVSDCQMHANLGRPVNYDPIICGLLNRAYGYRLASVNQTQLRFSAVNLIDPENSVAVEVTATNSRQKVNDAVRRFSEGEPGQRLCDGYKSLIVFIITNDHLRYMPPEGIDFTVQVLNMPALLSYIQTLSPEQLKEILDFLARELAGGSSFSGASQADFAAVGTAHLTAFSIDRQQVLRFACLLPEGGLPWALFRQCLSEAHQQALFLLAGEGYLTRKDDWILVSPEVRSSSLEQLLPTRENCAEFLDRLLQYDRTRFWQRLKLVDRRNVHLQLAKAFGQAAMILQDPNGSLALRCAGFYAEVNQTSTVLQWCLRAVQSCEAAPTRDPWCLGYAYMRTAECYQQLSDNANSLKYCKKALSLIKKELVLSDPDMARVHYQTGLAQVGLSDHPAALKSLKKALNYSADSITADHPLFSDINSMLSIASTATDNVMEAREYKLQSVRASTQSRSSHIQSAELAQKLAQLEKVQGLHPLFRGTKDEALCTEIGDLYHAQGDFAQALEYHMQALSLREQRANTAPKKLADSYHSIGMIFSDLEDHAEAMQYLQKATRIREAGSDIPSADLIRSYLDLGAVHSDCGMHQYALDYYKKALALQRETLPSDSPELAATYTALGNVSRTLGQDQEALDNYSSAIHILEASLAENHPDLAAACMNLANAHIQLAQHPMALCNARRALEIYEDIYPKGHPQRIIAQQTVSWLEDLTR